MRDTICEIVRKMESDYTSGATKTSKYVEFDMYETINKVDAYINSIHTSGKEDSIGREKPFFNIVTAARNIWFRATDIDRKNIKVRVPTTIMTAEAFAANMLIRRWMKKASFGVFLNEWGKNLATYGSAVSKFVEKNGELYCTNISWNRLICDQIDFENNIKIEVLEYTPSQLRKQKGYDQQMVEDLIENQAPREQLDSTKKDNKDNYIKVYEVHGELPLSLITENENDEDKYVQQMHVVAFTAKNGTDEYNEYTLYKGREKIDPYFITHLIKEDGRAIGIGAVEHLFEAQWMTNHTAKQIKDTLDFASLLLLQTADKNLAGENVLTSMVTGNILIHSDNQPLTQLNNSHDITQIQSFNNQWQSLAREITSTPDAIRGENQPAGTAWRQVEALRVESHSLFELMRENKGLAIEEMFRKYILPYIKTQMDTTEDITDILDSAGISQFNAMYVPNEVISRVNKKKIDTILSGQIFDGVDEQAVQGEVMGELGALGNVRTIKPDELDSITWKKALKDMELEMEVDPTQEMENITDSLASLTTTLQTIAGFAGRPMTPDERLVFNRIMEKSGTVSPIELSQAQSQSNQVQPPTGGGVSSEQFKQLKQPVVAEFAQ